MVKDDLTPSIQHQADTILQQVQAAQAEAAIKNAAIRQAERQAKMDAWQDPEIMQHRHAVHIKGAIESLWSLREAGQCEVQPPVPPDSELPKHMRGQQPSTIRAWLRGNPEWQKKLEAHKLLEEEKHNLRGKHPELWGINFSEVRKEKPVKLGDEHKVQLGKRITVKESNALRTHGGYQQNDENFFVFNQKPSLKDKIVGFFRK